MQSIPANKLQLPNTIQPEECPPASKYKAKNNRPARPAPPVRQGVLSSRRELIGFV
jgi:hypothetical protein